MNAVDEKIRNQAAQAAVSNLESSILFQRSRHIACYYPSAKEFNTLPIIEAILAAGKKCYLPVIHEDGSRILKFAEFNKSTVLKPNRFNILEPVVETFFDKKALDLVLMPLVAFNYSGVRLGSGGGYYDRTFAFKNKDEYEPPFLLGVGYLLIQEVSGLLQDEWDVLLDGVLTENSFSKFDSSLSRK